MVKYYCKSPTSLVGKTAIVTGANAGLGYETALEFAKRKGRVILACRNQEKANLARDKIIDATGNENVIVKIIDMGSFDSVREFAKDINETEPRLDILVNNAGGFFESQITSEGVQMAMQVNHHSPFLLTLLLLDLLKTSKPSRIVNVASNMAKRVRGFDVDELDTMSTSFYGSTAMYSKTKLCNILFTMELAKRLKGTGVTVYSLHPGAVYTEIQRSSRFMSWFASIFFLSAEEGAQTQIYCSLEEGIEEHSGKHFEKLKVVPTYSNAKDEKKAKQLWEKCEHIIGISSV